MWLGSELRGGLQVWSSFLEKFSGQALGMSDVLEAFDIEFYTGAAGSVGFDIPCFGTHRVNFLNECIN